MQARYQPSGKPEGTGQGHTRRFSPTLAISAHEGAAGLPPARALGYNHLRCRAVRTRAALPQKEAMPMSHINDVLGILGALAALATIADFVLTWWPRLTGALRKRRKNRPEG